MMEYIPTHLQKVGATIMLDRLDCHAPVVLTMRQPSFNGNVYLYLTKEDIPGIIAALQDTLEKEQ